MSDQDSRSGIDGSKTPRNGSVDHNTRENREVLPTIRQEEDMPRNLSPNHRGEKNLEEIQQLRHVPTNLFNVAQVLLEGAQAPSSGSKPGENQGTPLQEIQPVKVGCIPQLTRSTVIIALVVLAVLATAVILPVIFLRREASNPSRETRIAKVGHSEPIKRIFYNLKESDEQGYVNKGPGAASIVLDSARYVSGRMLGQGRNPDFRPYGYNDYFHPDTGITIRALNKENHIIYVERHRFLRHLHHLFHHVARIIHRHEKLIIPAIALVVAGIQNVSQSRVKVVKEEFWVGKRVGSSFQIELQDQEHLSTDPNDELPDNKTEDEIKNESQAIIDKVVAPILQQKVQHHWHSWEKIAALYSYEYLSTAQVYAYWITNHTLQNNSSIANKQEGKNSDQAQTDVPKQPTIHYESIFPQRPKMVSHGITIPKSIFESIVSCVDQSKERKACSITQWLRQDSPYKISQASLAKKDQFKTYIRYRISLQPLPADQVHQEFIKISSSLEVQTSEAQESGSSTQASSHSGPN